MQPSKNKLRSIKFQQSEFEFWFMLPYNSDPPIFNDGQFNAVFGRFSSFCFTYRHNGILAAILKFIFVTESPC